MGHFYAGVHGNRGPATRLGTKSSGMAVFANGWNIGVEIEMEHKNGEDIIYIYETTGSNGCQRALIMTLRENEE